MRYGQAFGNSETCDVNQPCFRKMSQSRGEGRRETASAAGRGRASPSPNPELGAGCGNEALEPRVPGLQE